MNTAERPYAIGGVVRGGVPVEIGRSGCATPTAITCECGRDLHITVNLDPAQIEAAVKKIMAGMRADALRWASRHSPQIGS